MPASGVVEEFDVVVDGAGELDPGLPAFAVEELDLHPPPERLDHRIVVCAADGPHRRSKAGAPNLAIIPLDDVDLRALVKARGAFDGEGGYKLLRQRFESLI